MEDKVHSSRLTEALVRAEFELVLRPHPYVSMSNTMLACRRCSWKMKHRPALGRWLQLWVCENWRPWNFWRHDLMRRTPTHRSPVM